MSKSKPALVMYKAKKIKRREGEFFETCPGCGARLFQKFLEEWDDYDERFYHVPGMLFFCGSKIKQKYFLQLKDCIRREAEGGAE